MEESKFIYDKHFILSHKKEILRIIRQGKLNPEGTDERCIQFANLVTITAFTPMFVMGVLYNHTRLRNASNRLAYIYEYGYLVDELFTYFQDADLRDLILIFIDVNTLSIVIPNAYNCNVDARLAKEVFESEDAYKLYRLQQKEGQTIISKNRDKFDGLIENRMTKDFINFSSAYKYLERLCFVKWCDWESQVNYGDNLLSQESIRNSYLRFKATSWFTLLEQNLDVEDSPEGVEHLLALYNSIIDDYTGIQVQDARELLIKAIWVFCILLKSIKASERYIVEEYECNNIAGIVIPENKSYNDSRIEIATDFLIQKHYLKDKERFAFISLMKGDGIDIEFGNGLNKKGEPKKTGGKSVLYWVLRYIIEPEKIDTRASDGIFDRIARHCYFNENPCTFRELSDNGTKSQNVKEEILAQLAVMEKERGIEDGLTKRKDAGK